MQIPMSIKHVTDITLYKGLSNPEYRQNVQLNAYESLNIITTCLLQDIPQNVTLGQSCILFQ